jgi:glutamyl endopeptidase
MAQHPASVTKPNSAAPESSPGSASASPVKHGFFGMGSQESSRSLRAYSVRPDDKLERRPAGRGPLPESIIGTDDRKRILDTDLAPWRMICALSIKGANGTAIGTGWFVGPRTLLTAGHCVFARELGGDGWAQSITIIPGRNGPEDQPYGAVTATNFSIHKNWGEGHHQDFDIGCIHLTEPLGEKTGWFGFASFKPEDLKEKLVNVSGYPADKGFGREQYFHADRVHNVTARRVFYEVDTFGGQSGSPVWIQADSSSAPVAVAVHAYGVSTSDSPMNSAPRIDDEIFELINHWIEQDKKVPVA